MAASFTTYSIRVARKDPEGRSEVIDFKAYSDLRQLLDDITEAVDERGWLEDEQSDQDARKGGGELL